MCSRRLRACHHAHPQALKKSINGIVNKVNILNIKNMLAEVFRENLVRGRGLFCRSLMKSQLASPTFSPVYAGAAAMGCRCRGGQGGQQSGWLLRLQACGLG